MMAICRGPLTLLGSLEQVRIAGYFSCFIATVPLSCKLPVKPKEQSRPISGPSPTFRRNHKSNVIVVELSRSVHSSGVSSSNSVGRIVSPLAWSCLSSTVLSSWIVLLSYSVAYYHEYHAITLNHHYADDVIVSGYH
jgi:hypothetical protein